MTCDWELEDIPKVSEDGKEQTNTDCIFFRLCTSRHIVLKASTVPVFTTLTLHVRVVYKQSNQHNNVPYDNMPCECWHGYFHKVLGNSNTVS